jgi:hypothetical protein
VLAGERGLLVDFRSADGLAKQCLRILDDRDLKRRVEHNAYAYGRETVWPRIGERMLAVLRDAATARRKHSIDAWSLEPLVLQQADARTLRPPLERAKTALNWPGSWRICRRTTDGSLTSSSTGAAIRI